MQHTSTLVSGSFYFFTYVTLNTRSRVGSYTCRLFDIACPLTRWSTLTTQSTGPLVCGQFISSEYPIIFVDYTA